MNFCCIRNRGARAGVWLTALGCLTLLLSLQVSVQTAKAQLEVTEVMFNPLDEDVWEWIEVRNTGAEINLDGAFADRLGDGQIPSGSNPNVSSLVAQNTIIPAGSVAVLYDGNLAGTSPGDFDDQSFRDAWGLGAGVPLIGVDFFPPLTNTGKAFGFWEDFNAYEADLVDDGTGMETFEVGGFNNTLFSLDYRTDFPASTNGNSMQWNGSGSNANGLNWALSQSGVGGAVTSVATSIAGGAINSTEDAGNPGITTGTPATTGLIISEIMYNPRSLPDAPWEWVEIYNNTGATIDFAATPYILDDDDFGAIGTANIASGTLDNGSTAVLINGDLNNVVDMITAWDPGGANGVNFIAVSDFPALGNSGDTVALWDNFTTYTIDKGADITLGAVSVVDYTDNENDIDNPWPQDNGSGSILLTDLALDQNIGLNWLISGPFDPYGSFNASAVLGTVDIHAGGDVGSPGTFDNSVISADFDEDGDVDGYDFLIWQRGVGTTDDAAYLAAWQDQFGSTTATAATSAVPEPTSLMLLGLALTATPLLAGRSHGRSFA
ncbi:MAG: lamin tail domain-containing protein [Pirellulales bacterium]